MSVQYACAVCRGPMGFALGVEHGLFCWRCDRQKVEHARRLVQLEGARPRIVLARIKERPIVVERADEEERSDDPVERAYSYRVPALRRPELEATRSEFQKWDRSLRNAAFYVASVAAVAVGVPVLVVLLGSC